MSDVAPPAPDDLERIDPDTWALLLRHVRAAMHELDEDRLTAGLRRLRASPASRLAGGRMRRALAETLAKGGELWRDVHARVADDASLADALGWLIDGEPAPNRPTPARRPPPTAPAAPDEQVRALKERARALKDARDDERRRADGAEARAELAEEKLASATEDLAALQAQVQELETQLAARDDERERAIERERRRNASEVAELREELREMRRAEQQRRERRQRERAQQQQAREQAQRGPARPRPRPPSPPATRAVPGRPSRLPQDVADGTTEQARALLERGRRVIVDGYNVTKQHQPQLDLAEQRVWLVRWLAGLAARRKVRPTVVFDGAAGPVGSAAGERARGVAVRFSQDGLTADDEIEFAVAALDPQEPVLVVTDDRELADRVRAYRADVVGTRPFLGAGS